MERVILSHEWRQRWLMLGAAQLVSWLLRGLYMTLRPTYVQQHFACPLRQTGKPFLPTFWHGRLLYVICLYYRQRSTVLVSHSKDGAFISQILACIGGVPAARGSSSRGGARGLLALIKQVRCGYIAGFTPDGPRGPRYQVQPGVVTVAKKTGAAILPVTYNARWKKVLRTWDRFIIPLPFSRVVVVYGAPIYIAAHACDATFEATRQEVETSLRQITEIADGYFQASGKSQRPKRAGV